eukprot:m.170032 g.170032  ORF g.170032 m.170032 type:complete len:409 (-) comp14784_c0_seq2:320-1546(-)
MGCLSGDTLAIETDQRTRCTVHPIPTCPLQDTSQWLSKGVLCDVTPRAGGSHLLTPLFSRTATCTEGFGGGGAADDTLLLWNEPVFDHHFQRSSVPQGQSGSVLDGGYLYLRTGLSAAAGRGACAARPPQGGNTPRGGFDGQFSPGTGESVEVVIGCRTSQQPSNVPVTVPEASPAGAGWFQLGGVYSIRNHNGAAVDVKFFSKVFQDGDEIIACCKNEWATGVFAAPLPSPCTSVAWHSVTNGETWCLPNFDLATATGRNRQLWSNPSVSNPSTLLDHTFLASSEPTTGAGGLFSGAYTYMRSSIYDSAGRGGCGSAGGGFTGTIHRASEVVIGCRHRVDETVDNSLNVPSGWTPVEPATTFIIANHEGTAVNVRWFARSAAAGEVVNACCPQEWATGLFVAPISPP